MAKKKTSSKVIPDASKKVSQGFCRIMDTIEDEKSRMSEAEIAAFEIMLGDYFAEGIAPTAAEPEAEEPKPEEWD
jgi:hypothetical protein